MLKKAYIGRTTYNRLIKHLNLNELKIIDERKVGNRAVLCVEALNSTLNTNWDKYIFNNRNGLFFIKSKNGKDQKIKMTKVLKALWGIKDNRKLQELKNIWERIYNPIKEIKVSDKISKIYNLKHANAGSIGDSCMKGNGSYYHNFDEIDFVKIAYLYDEKEEKLLGRALLWNCVYVDFQDEPIKLMDRIYSANETIENAFKKWAIEHGYYYKAYQSSDEPEAIIDPKSKEKIETEMYVELPFKLKEPVPFMDTFYFYDEDNLILANSDALIDGDYYELRRTDGYIDDNVVDYCYRCGEVIREGDEYYQSYITGNCYCTACAEDYLVWCIDVGDHAEIDRAFYCETNGEYYAYDNELIKINGKYYLESDPDIACCQCCSHYYLQRDCMYVEFNFYFENGFHHAVLCLCKKCKKQIENYIEVIYGKDIANEFRNTGVLTVGLGKNYVEVGMGYSPNITFYINTSKSPLCIRRNFEGKLLAFIDKEFRLVVDIEDNIVKIIPYGLLIGDFIRFLPQRKNITEHYMIYKVNGWIDTLKNADYRCDIVNGKVIPRSELAKAILEDKPLILCPSCNKLHVIDNKSCKMEVA